MKQEIKLIKTLDKNSSGKNVYGLKLETISNNEYQIAKTQQYQFKTKKHRDEAYTKIHMNINKTIVDIKDGLELITNE